MKIKRKISIVISTMVLQFLNEMFFTTLKLFSKKKNSNGQKKKKCLQKLNESIKNCK